MSSGSLDSVKRGVTLKQVAKDFGISESCLTNWMTQADRDAGIKPGADREELTELREAKRRIRRRYPQHPPSDWSPLDAGEHWDEDY